MSNLSLNPPSSLPATGYVRIQKILEVFPVSKSTWWAGVRSGRFPKPVKLGPRITAWKVDDILILLEKPSLTGGE